jgi:hypothetical protein
MAPRLSRFQERHTLEFGLTIQHRNDVDQKVDSVRCEFCQLFGREAKTDAIRAARSSVAFFVPPYRRGAYEAHHVSQHPVKWAEYQQLTVVEQMTFFGATTTTNNTGTVGANALMKEECERLKVENEMWKKKLRKCQEKLSVKEMYAKHDKTKIENLEKEKAQLEDINRMLEGNSDDDSTSDLDINIGD